MCLVRLKKASMNVHGIDDSIESEEYISFRLKIKCLKYFLTRESQFCSAELYFLQKYSIVITKLD